MKFKHKLSIFLLFLVFCLTIPAPISLAAGTNTVPRNTLRAENGKFYYYNSRGKKLKKAWKTIKKHRYYFTKDGSAATGTATISKKKYLFSEKGVLLKNGFKTVNGRKYYVNSKGIRSTGWKTIKKKRYCFTSAGVLRTEWYKSGSKTYYFSSRDGAMYTGWHTIDGKQYYFNSKGVMAKNTWVGSKYLNSSGIYDAAKKMTMAKLQSKLRSTLKSYSGSWSVYVKNLDTGESFSINNRKMYAASLIKLYAMGAAYDKIQQGKIKESSVKSTIKNMITISSNDAFNTIVRKVGTTYVNKWCKKNGYTKTNQGHGLSPSSNNYGLSNGSGSNTTSVIDCGKFLESVYKGTCVSPSASKKMLKYLKQQTRRSKIPAGVPRGVTVANKTGETDDTTHDAAIVYSKGATYILCVMATTPGTAWSSASKITKLSRITYNYFN